MIYKNIPPARLVPRMQREREWYTLLKPETVITPWNPAAD